MTTASPVVNALPLTYPDVVGYEDVDAWGRETQSDLENLAQDVFHLLYESPNTNLDDANANGLTGLGVEEALNAGQETLTGLANRIDKMLEIDDRIDSSTTTIIPEDDGSFTIQIEIDVDGSVLPLTFSFSQAGGLQVLS